MVPDSSANSLRRHCPDQVKGTPLSADLSLTAPCFYVRVQYSAAGRQKSTLADIIAGPAHRL